MYPHEKEISKEDKMICSLSIAIVIIGALVADRGHDLAGFAIAAVAFVVFVQMKGDTTP